jgi:hypothetical protein
MARHLYFILSYDKAGFVPHYIKVKRACGNPWDFDLKTKNYWNVTQNATLLEVVR